MFRLLLSHLQILQDTDPSNLVLLLLLLLRARLH
jgi:hypothetical protein